VKLLKAIVAFTFGIALERSIASDPSGIELTIALGAAALIVAVAIFSRKHVTISVLLLVVLLGMARAITSDSSETTLPWNDIPRNEERVNLEGTLLSDPSPSNDRVRLRLKIEQATDSASDYFVDVYTNRLHDKTSSTRRSNDFRYGDSYRVNGRFILTTGRDDVAGIISTSSVELIDAGNGNALRARIANFRANISHDITYALDSKSGGLAAALLVGDRTKLHPDTITDFRASGLSHVLAISGLHIAMIGGIIMAISVWILGRQRQLYYLHQR
jgi:predicted membrane metal-binding protein